MAKTLAIEFSRPLLKVVLVSEEEGISAPAQAAACVGGSAAAQTQLTSHSEPPYRNPTGGETGGPLQAEALAEQRRCAELMDRLIEALDELEARRQQSIIELQQVAVELAVRVAESLTRAAIAKDEFAVEELVKRAIEKLGLGGPVRIYLNPEDLALLSRRLSTQPDRLNRDTRIELVSSPEVERGDCIAEAGEVMVASQLELRLEELRQDLLDALEHAQVERRRASAPDRPLGRFPDRRQTA